jgi:hypothetical protein
MPAGMTYEDHPAAEFEDVSPRDMMLCAPDLAARPHV